MIDPDESGEEETLEVEQQEALVAYDWKADKEEIQKLRDNKKLRVILWFKADLRTHDNGMLEWAKNKYKKLRENIEILPVFIFDPRFYTYTSKLYRTRRCGIKRTIFMHESVQNLRHKL